MRDAALALAGQGLPVFQLHHPTQDGCSCGNAPCASPGKHPRTPGWQDKATTDAGQIRTWWTTSPNANIGIRTGDGLYIVDVDGEKGQRSLTALDLRPTRTARTGHGVHLYYHSPAGAELGNAGGATIADGIHGRGDGGYVVAPGSLHPSGSRYAWANEAPIAELPAAIVERLTDRRTGTAVEFTPEKRAEFKAAGEAWSPGERAELETEARRRMEQVARDLAALPLSEGNGRGDKFYGAAWSLGEAVGAGVLDLDAARPVLMEAAGRLGVGERHRRSIDRGLAIGAANPLQPDPSIFDPTAMPEAVADPSSGLRNEPHHHLPGEASSGVPAGAREDDTTNSRYAGRRVDIRAWLAKDPEPPIWWCDGVVMGGALTIIAGQAAAGKSWLYLALAHGVSTGETVAGIKCKQGPAILVDAEMGAQQFVERIRGSGLGERCHLYTAGGLDLSRPDDQEWLRSTIKEHIDPEEGGFVGIDSLRRLTPSKRENESDDMAPVIVFLGDLARETNAGILLLHHKGHAAGHARGSSSIIDQADAMLSFDRVPGNEELRKLSCRGEGGKMRMAREPDDRYLRIPENGGIALADKPETKGAQYRELILAALPQKTKSAAAESSGTNDGNKVWQAAWKKLLKDGLIKQDPASKEWVRTAAGDDANEPPL